MQILFVSLGAIGAAAFGVSAFSLFFLWAYLVLRITGNYSGSAGQDAMARKLAALFGKIFAASLVYVVALILVIHIVGPPH